jgi:hypothetical protein
MAPTFGVTRATSRYRPWAELLRRTFDVDVETCPRCGGRMRLLALVTQPKNVERFLRHFGEPPEPPPRSAYRQSSPGSGTGNTLRYEYELPSPGLGNTARLVGLEQEMLDEFGETVALEVGYSYDQFGRTDVISYPRAGSTNEPFDLRHEYDGESGVLRAIRDEASGRVLWELMEADQGFRIGRERFGNGIESVQDYYSITDPVPACSTVNDSACPVGLLRSISVTKPGEPDPLFQFDYEFDWNLKRRSRQDVDKVEGFDYDLFDQVVEHYSVQGTSTVPIGSFRYDTLGNIERRKLGVLLRDSGRLGRARRLDRWG